MSRGYTPGLWTVTSWNVRAMECRADERVVYRGTDAAEAVRVFDGLSRWKRRGIVEMTSPIGLVSTTCKPTDPRFAPWSTRYAHPLV